MRISPPSRISLVIRTRRYIARHVEAVLPNLDALHIATLEPELFAFTHRRVSTASGARSVQVEVFAYDARSRRSSDLDDATVARFRDKTRDTVKDRGAAARAIACLVLGDIV